MTAAASRENRWASAGGNSGASSRPAGAAAGSAQAADSAAPAKPSRFKSRKFLISLAAVVLLIGGGAYMFLKPTPPYVPSGGDIVALDPTTVNLTDGHYLKVTYAIELLKDKASATDFHTSEAAELVIDQFANRSMGALSSNAARNKLSADLFAKLKKAYPDEIFKIHLTQFVMQ